MLTGSSGPHALVPMPSQVEVVPGHSERAMFLVLCAYGALLTSIFLPGSCGMKLNLDYLLEMLWEYLALTCIYTKKRGRESSSLSQESAPPRAQPLLFTSPPFSHLRTATDLHPRLVETSA